jgi:Fe-S-cluster containining protein
MKKAEVELSPDFIKRVADLYRDMADAYDLTAKELSFSCNGCPDNCCDSFFRHHTYTEWAYLWLGLKTLDSKQLQTIQAKAAQYVIESEAALVRGERPIIMCPLNDDGLCTMYSYRMMLCRLHGVPATLTRPDGEKLEFPGCFRCQEQTPAENPFPRLDRTRFLQTLVTLEIGLLGNRRMTASRVKLSIAQMIVKGPPILQYE